MYEFNLSMNRLVKWPVFVHHGDEKRKGYKLFEVLRNWKTKESMNKELHSPEYENLMGAIKVLGEIKESHLFKTVEKIELIQ